MSKLTVILGAGFSATVGLPLGRDIKERFDRDQKGKLLIISSSEWFWIDGKDDTFIHNGSIYSERIFYSYILNQLVKEYKKEQGRFVDYEDFFQYLFSKFEQNDGWLENVYALAKKELFLDFPIWSTKEALEYHPYINDRPFKSKINGIMNHLIADLLNVKISDKQLVENYDYFLKYIMGFDEVSIFTLNHDLILERLFDLKGIKYTRGFTDENSEIYFEDKQLEIFNDDFKNTNIKIYKLHGSLDYFQYCKSDKTLNYFTTLGYRTKHYAQTRNIETNEVISEFNTDVVPKFITGKNKSLIIKKDFMYSRLFDHFEQEIETTKNIFISGYSFGDIHINAELMKRSDINIINQNPYTKYPFEGFIRNIESLEELNTL
jgi:hypothetical protein